MTRTYHDIEAVTRLLQEKEKDLELAAKIGQELLERNKYLDERVTSLEGSALSSNELITQLRHDLTIKTGLLRAYTNDDNSSILNDASPDELRNVNIDLLKKRIKDLEDDNKKLQEEASELSKEAYEFEEKEEKLVSDAVKHLTEANVQISYLNEEFTVKQDESFKQREEITHLLAQVCDLQTKVRTFKQENEDLDANVLIYKETQDELTKELAEFKEKYREVVDLLKDAQEELKVSRKKGAFYPGLGSHNLHGMFPSENEPPSKKGKGDSLLDEIHDTLKASKTIHPNVSDEEIEFSSRTGSGSNQYLSGGTAYNRAFNTYRYANQTGGYLARTASENAYGSYTISRDNSCLDLCELSGPLGKDPLAVPLSTKSIYGSSLSLISSYKEEKPLKLVDFEIKSNEAKIEEDNNVIVQTVGELSLPSAKSNRNLRALAMPLGYVPGQDKPASINSWLESSPDIQGVPGGIPLGSVPSKIRNRGRPLGPVPEHSSIPNEESQSCDVFNNIEKLLPMSHGRRGSLHAECQTSNLTLPPESLLIGVLGSAPLGSVPGLCGETTYGSEEDLLESANNLTLPPISLPVGVLGSAPLGSVPGMKDQNESEELESTSGLTLPPQSLSVGILGSAPLGSVPGFSQSSKNKSLGAIGGGDYENELLEPAFNLTIHPNTLNQPPPLTVTSISNDKDSNSDEHKPTTIQERSASSAITGSWDSGVLSGDYNEVRGGAADGFSESGDIEFSVPTHNGELERALQKLNPVDIERRRRKLIGQHCSFDLGSEGYGSPPNVNADSKDPHTKEHLRSNKYNLPYGVQTPDSIYSLSSKDWNVGRSGRLSGSNYNINGNSNWKLHDKLRIVKPLEGSLTLHNWSQLARPSLSGILEEKSGIVIKGGNIMGITCDELDSSEFGYSDFGGDSSFIRSGTNSFDHSHNIPDTNTRQTYTDSTVIHPENPETTSTYSEYQLASGFKNINKMSRFSSFASSRFSSRLQSTTDLRAVGTTNKFVGSGLGTSTFSTNIGIASLLNERNIHGGSNMSIYEPSIGGSVYEPSQIGSLYEPSQIGSYYEPSIAESFYDPSIMSITSRMSSRIGTRRASITDLNDVIEEYKIFSPTGTPTNSPLHSPPNESSGFVSSIFASLKASFYGNSSRKPSKNIRNSILKGGVQKKRRGFGILKKVEEVGLDNLLSHSSSVSSLFTEFEEIRLGDCDELKDIIPGSITLRHRPGSSNSREESFSPPPLESIQATDLSGVLVPPSFTTYGRPSLNRAELGTVPDLDEHGPGIMLHRDNLNVGYLGVPGIPGTDALQKIRPDLGSVPENLSPITLENRSMKNSSSVMGNITTMFFGRKGGLL
uniref:Trafficking kinesinbinding protein miltlike [Bombus terrestris] n=1 Tax=Lepeophtheirus salmonis TaxID=72036 RepID=A0A0K2UZG7_LEPSM